MRSSSRQGAKISGSCKSHTAHGDASEPLAFKIPLTARRAASLAASIVARSVLVRT